MSHGAHYGGCVKVHVDCANKEIERLEALLEAKRTARQQAERGRDEARELGRRAFLIGQMFAELLEIRTRDLNREIGERADAEAQVVRLREALVRRGCEWNSTTLKVAPPDCWRPSDPCETCRVVAALADAPQRRHEPPCKAGVDPECATCICVPREEKP